MVPESIDEMLAFIDNTARPLIESLEGYLVFQSVKTTESESIMVSFYRAKEAADSASQKAAPIFQEMAKWMSAPPKVLGEGTVMRSLNLGY